MVKILASLSSYLQPHLIIDKNGHQKTVHKNPTAKTASRTKPLPTPTVAISKIGSENIEFENVFTDMEQKEIDDNSNYFIIKLQELTGWDMLVTARDIGDVPISDVIRKSILLRTPNGKLVDHYGVISEEEYINNSIEKNHRLYHVEPEDYDIVKPESPEDATIDFSVAAEKAFNFMGGQCDKWRITTDDVESVTVNGKSFFVTPENCEAEVCPACNTFRTHSSTSSQFNSCQFCGKSFYLGDGTIAIRQDSVAFTNPRNVRKATWYHISSRENWVSDIDSSPKTPVVHLGTKAAALERADHLLDESPEMKLYLYEVVLSRRAKIGRDISEDDNIYQPEFVKDMDVRKDLDGDANRYLNVYEGLGSISLMVNPNIMKVQSSSVLTTK